MSSVPKPLLRKRADIAHELHIAEDKAAELRVKLQTLDGAIRIMSPGWKAPDGPARKRPAPTTTARHGDIGSGAIQALKVSNNPMTAAEIAAAIAAVRQMPVGDGLKRKRFVSAVLSAMRRYEAKGFVSALQADGSKTPRWSLRR